VGQKNVIYTVHGFHFYKGAPLKNWLLYYPMECLAGKWTDKILTMNDEDFERAKKIASKKTKIFKINGVGLDLNEYSVGDGVRIRKELDLNEEDFLFSIIGEINQNKNQIQIIKALELLEKQNIEMKLLIVGFGPKEMELREYVKNKNLEKKIYFLGHREDIKNIIAASDGMVSMSYREGLPRNIMEGMAQGKPFIVTDIRGNRDIIKDGVNGYLVNVDDVEGTAEKIKLLMDKERCKEIKSNNLRDVKRFSIDKIMEEMAGIYREKGG
ncbi:MAG: glycosyltransferase, partial [Fusobacteriaceae bacterium]